MQQLCWQEAWTKVLVNFYSFPVRDKPRFKRWVVAVRRAKWTPMGHTKYAMSISLNSCNHAFFLPFKRKWIIAKH